MLTFTLAVIVLAVLADYAMSNRSDFVAHVKDRYGSIVAYFKGT